jgi:hypothetical protein
MRVSVSVAFGAMLLARSAHADDPSAKARCEASYESAQRLKRDEHLSAAKAELTICTETCPRPLAADCSRWLADVTALMPTVRISASDRERRPLAEIQVSIDGGAMAWESDSAIAIEPGTHGLRIDAKGYVSAELRIEVHAGERDRRIDAVLDRERPAPPPSMPVSTRAPSNTASYVLGGVGAAALVTGGVLAVVGHVDRAHLVGTCSPFCTEDRVRPIRAMWVTAGVLGGAGAVLLGAAFVLWRSSEQTVTLGAGPRAISLAVTAP